MTEISEDYDNNFYDEDEDSRVIPETDNRRWELDEEPVIQSLRYELRKRMNERGVEAVLSWLRVCLSKNVALSNLNQNEINDFMRDELPSFNLELVQNGIEWGIKNSSARNAVSRWIELSMYTQLKRAYGDGERKYRKDSYNYNENYSHDEVNSGEIGGGFRIPNPFKKRPRPSREQYQDEF